VLIPISDLAGELRVDVGIIGGSGFYDLVDVSRVVEVATPFGVPAGPVSVATVAGRRVAFLPRHGRHHQFAAHRVPYRANIWALASLGVRTIVAPCSVGSLREDIEPGDFVIVDQLVDRTWGRTDTFHDVGAPDGTAGSEGAVHHQSFAEPYDRSVRAALLNAAHEVGVTTHDGGTMVVINGPRFSTRAESTWFRDMGWHVVNMTGYPEAVLAAEAGVRYATVALVTDHDAGVHGHAPVTMEAVLDVMARNVDRVRDVLAAVLPSLL
jgi:5'-methylthioadenosine phosphorylase